MSALTDLFSAMANKIRSKTGTATTYTPPQMVSNGIDDVFDAGVASATTSITPSNSSPVSMAANTGYKPTAAGYAISSYNSVTPSNSSPVALASGDIDKMGGAGYAIQSYSSVTPSNSSPVDLASGSIYKMGGAGKAVASVTSLAPSNSSPATISSGTVYKASANGKAVSSVTTLTPSDSSPATITSGTVYKASANGKAVSAVNSITVSTVPRSVTSGSVYTFSSAGEVVTPISYITPSNSSPVSLTYSGNYHMMGNGKAVASITDITPTTQGESFSAGILNTSAAGYAYTVKPVINEWRLWENSNPTGNFDGQEVSLSSALSNYDYIKIGYRVSKTNSTAAYVIMSTSDFINNTSGDDVCRLGISVNVGGTLWSRGARYVSNTAINFSKAYKGTTGTGSTSTANAIPTEIIGAELVNVPIQMVI